MNEKKKIYVAYTGGTIGMKQSNQGYRPMEGFLTEAIKEKADLFHPEMPTFDICEYSPLLDSSNMAPSDWRRIAQDVQSRYEDYDGFVILHGTDTMAYTASALSFLFENLSKPVIVTGSQIPLSALRSDGHTNLLNALYIAAHHPIPEVGLFFDNVLYRGNRSTKAHSDGFSAFRSPNFDPLLEAGITIKNYSTTDHSLKGSPPLSLKVANVTPQNVAVFTLYPGINHEIIEHTLAQPVRALILRTYGVGNAPETPSLLKTLQKADEQGILIVNLSQCFKGRVNMDGYATGKALADIGVVSGQDMTLEATLTKLHYLLSQPLSHEKRKIQVLTNLRGELSP
ncbi:asparaginase [Marinibactrum halimedae]|uniref:L-asparaginase 1 n=1 Tax=Marinibactrum halimedae TaxID=1444977 RepID=A0AA37WM53_9GAMM|nr:asparaginase [Marinibactrum halimedae]MCD9458942.1 asparaginase [Marinibactrum halimedae]GLS26929.1 L-asparaginase 1 [Marinibactrum halimedae]